MDRFCSLNFFVENAQFMEFFFYAKKYEKSKILFTKGRICVTITSSG